MTPERHGSGGLRILVVEDDVTLAQLTAALHTQGVPPCQKTRTPNW
jgi:hypothetical protein